MNPDSFIPFYGNDFLQAVEGQPDYIAMGYFRVIWHFWNHNHCRGLRDDQDFLRRLARVERDAWPEAMSFIFDNEKQFTLGEDGLWYQSRAVTEWNKSLDSYRAKVARTAAATAARLSKVKGKKR